MTEYDNTNVQELAAFAAALFQEINGTKQKDNIRIEGYDGTWHVIGECEWEGEKALLLRNEAYAPIIVNENLEVILDDMWDGFDNEKIEDFCNDFEDAE